MANQLREDHGEEGGVRPDAVLHHQDHLHPGHPGVVFHVELVLDVLDDGEEDAHVTLPEEQAVELGDVVPQDEIGEFAPVVGQDDHRDVEAGLARLVGELDGVHVPDVHGGDDEVE